MNTHRELKDAYYRLKVRFNNGTITQDERIQMGALQRQIVESKKIIHRNYAECSNEIPISDDMELILNQLKYNQEILNQSCDKSNWNNINELYEIKNNPEIPLATSSI